MSEILERLFGSRERARLLRFFLQNPEQLYEFSEVVRKNMINAAKSRRELNNLVAIKFIIRRTKQGKHSYQLNQNFNFYPELKNLIGSSERRLLIATLAKLDIFISPIEEFLSFIKLIIALGSFHDDGDLFIWNEIGKRMI